MNNEVITMVKCFYCNKEWIPEDAPINRICSECVPKYHADLAHFSLIEALDNLEAIRDISVIKPILIDNAIGILTSLREDIRQLNE